MKAILFDLDGTLLPMDTEKFMKIYASEVTKAFQGFDEAEMIFPQIMKSIGTVVKSREENTNYEKFFLDFENKMPKTRHEYLEVFDKFYETGFLNVKNATSQSEHIIEAVQILKEKGYQLVIATNPIFPMAANRHRIAWAGLNIDDFDHVTSFEKNMHCKPSLEFYGEVLSEAGLKGEDVLMVGNDVQEDMVIKALGAKTYLINNYVINRLPNEEIPADYTGNYEDFLEFVKALS